jgi:hypothetical protein
MVPRKPIYTIAFIISAAPASGFSQLDFSVRSYDPESGTITITADAETEFGPGPENVVLFDSFEDHAGSVSKSGPLVGQWWKIEDAAIHEEHAFSGSKSALLIDTSDGNQKSLRFAIPDNGATKANGMRLFQEIYFSYAIKDLANFPGKGGTENSFADASSAKDAWLMLGARGDAGWKEVYGQWTGNDLYIPGYNSGGFLVHGNSTNLREWQGTFTKDWAFGDWNQIFFHGEIDDQSPYSSGTGFFGFANKHFMDFNHFSKALVTRSDKKPFWDRLKFAPWYQLRNGNVRRLFDEIYVAIGDHANARVLIGDAEYLANVSRLHHALPRAWDTSQISANVDHLGLAEDQDWYIYVYTAEGVRNYQGVPLKTIIVDDWPDSDGRSNTRESADPEQSDHSESTPNQDGKDAGSAVSVDPGEGGGNQSHSADTTTSSVESPEGAKQSDTDPQSATTDSDASDSSPSLDGQAQSSDKSPSQAPTSSEGRIQGKPDQEAQGRDYVPSSGGSSTSSNRASPSRGHKLGASSPASGDGSGAGGSGPSGGRNPTTSTPNGSGGGSSGTASNNGRPNSRLSADDGGRGAARERPISASEDTNNSSPNASLENTAPEAHATSAGRTVANTAASENAATGTEPATIKNSRPARAGSQSVSPHSPARSRGLIGATESEGGDGNRVDLTKSVVLVGPTHAVRPLLRLADIARSIEW